LHFFGGNVTLRPVIVQSFSQSVSQSVLVSSPAWCSWSDLILYMECWCQTRSALPDEGVGLSGVMSRHLCQLHVYNDRINDWWQRSLSVVHPRARVPCLLFAPQ